MTTYVGIVTYNSLADLPGCLEALRRQIASQIVLIVLDNASQDGCAMWLHEHAPEVQLMVNIKNVGYGIAHNTIIQSINLQLNDYYMVLNPDVELGRDYIALLVEHLEKHKDVGWATGKLLMKDRHGKPTGQIYSAGHGMLRSGFAFNIGYGFADKDACLDDSREVFGASGAAALYKAKLIRGVSSQGYFFDPSMFMYAEDTDVDWRAQRQGWHCWYVADAKALHRGSSPNDEFKMMAVANRYVSVLKNADLLDLLTFNLFYLILHCLLRLVMSPRLGIKLVKSILRRAPTAIYHRTPSKVTRKTLSKWYMWSAQQPTMQHSQLETLLMRLNLFKR